MLLCDKGVQLVSMGRQRTGKSYTMDHLPFYAIFEKPVPLDLNFSFSSPTHHQHSSSSSTRQQVYKRSGVLPMTAFTLLQPR